MTRILLMPILLCLLGIAGHAQVIKFQEGTRIDTLYISLEIADGVSDHISKVFRGDLDSVVADFNSQMKQLTFVVDSSAEENVLRLKLSEVDYIGRKRNLVFTALNLAFLSGTVYFYYRTAIVFPFLVFPSANIKVTAELSPDLSESETGATFNASGNGFWLKNEKQDSRLRGAVEDTIVRIFKRTNRRYARNIKREAKKSEETREKRRSLL